MRMVLGRVRPWMVVDQARTMAIQVPAAGTSGRPV
jgi:hypothetical protein